jgi:hypothetical protein
MEYQVKARTVRVIIDEEFGIFDTQTRFDICDVNGEVIDNAQGYGYKTAQSAHKAASYKFKGGKQKVDTAKASAKAFWRNNQDFANKLIYVLEANFKDSPTEAEIVAFAAECGVVAFDTKYMNYIP